MQKYRSVTARDSEVFLFSAFIFSFYFQLLFSAFIFSFYFQLLFSAFIFSFYFQHQKHQKLF